MKKKIVLIDGHSILNRAFYGIPELTNSKGLHTNGVYGFLNIMFKILEEEQPDYLTVAFDVKVPTFRHELFKEYKGTRKGMPEELKEQVPVLKQILAAMDIPVIEQAGIEADDILGTIAKHCEKEGVKVSLVSGDRDMLQLASKNIIIRIPKTKKGTTTVEDYSESEVYDLYQVTPTEFIDMKALMGDASDNIPGVPSIGEKTAGKLISTYHSIEECYARIDEIKPARAQNALREHYELAQLSKVLAKIKTDCKLEFSLEKAKMGELFTKEAYELLKNLEFKSLLKRFDNLPLDEIEEERLQSIPFLIEDKEGIENLIENLKKEKFSLMFIHEKEKIIGLSLHYAGKVTYYIEEISLIMELLRAIKERKLHFITSDWKKQLRALWLSQAQEDLLTNWDGEQFEDLALATYLLNPLKDSYEYDDTARDYLEMTLPSRSDLFKKANLEEVKVENEEEYLRYCGYLSMVPFLAWEEVKKSLVQEEMYDLYREVEIPLSLTLFYMEKEGICVNRESLSIYGEQLAAQIEVLENDIYEICGEQFNINSPKQLGVILFEKMDIPFKKKTKTGYSTAADVLEKLRIDYPVVDKILEYRQLTKLKSTYADGLSAFIGEDGRIHGKFNQTITATGRISSTEPNLQNIPIRMEIGRKIRRVFEPDKNLVFIDADYSQIELRVLAHMSGDKRLIDAYNQAEDIHAITASEVFHVPLNEVTPELRRKAKAVNFGIVYGISAFGLSEDLSVSRKEANDYIEQYFKTYPAIKAFLDELVVKAKKTGYSKTLFNRIRPVGELKSSNFMQRQFGERIAMNAPIQGTAADIIKIAMVHVDKRLREEQLKAKLLLQIHDELLIEAPLDEVEQVKTILADEMKNAAKLSVSLEIDMHTGKNWLEAH